jgi:hypothetical protein
MLDDAMGGAAIGAVAAALVMVVLVFARKPVVCEKCGALQPKFRNPKNVSQLLWGGYTCSGCGSELSARGKVKV